MITNISKKKQAIIDNNNQYLSDLGDRLGFNVNSEPITQYNVPLWQVNVAPKEAALFSIRYTMGSEKHSKLIDDESMHKMINERISPKDHFGKGLHEKFKESFNKYYDSMKLAEDLQNKLSQKQEQKQITKIKI